MSYAYIPPTIYADDVTIGDQLTLSNTTDGQGQIIINAGADGENAFTINDLTTARWVLDIDATTTDFLDITPVVTTANVIDLVSTSITQGNIIDIGDANGLTSGKILNLVSNSADTGTRTLVQITNDNTLATGATVLALQQDAVQTACLIDMNANGVSLRMESTATTSSVVQVVDPNTLSGVCFDIAALNNLSTGTGLRVLSDGTNTSTRSLVQFTNDNILATGATVLSLKQDSTGLAFNCDGPIDIAPAIVASATALPSVVVTGAAHTGLTASTEAIDISLVLARTVEFATGALTTQRAVNITAPTYGFVGISTLTTAVTFAVSASPAAGANATITNSYVAQFGGAVNLGSTSTPQTYGVINIPAHTVTVTGTTQVTSVGFAGVRIGTLTLTDASAVTIDNSAAIYVAAAPVAAGSVTLTNPYSLWIDAGASRFDGRVLETQGADVASATNLTLGTDGNVFELTGTTKVDLISNVGWQEGSIVVIIANESVVIDHGTVSSGTNIQILLAGAVDYSMTANDTLTLMLSSTTAGGQAWREIARTVI